MDSHRLEIALGQPFESPEVQSLVKELGLTKAPKAKKDDPDSYLANKALGAELMFVDNDYIERKKVARYGNAPMIFVGATLYSGGQTDDPSMRRFGGPLPGGATFDDGVKLLVAKLGTPTRVYEDDGVVYTRTWVRDGRRVTFNYNEAGTLQYLQINWDVYMIRVREG